MRVIIEKSWYIYLYMNVITAIILIINYMDGWQIQQILIAQGSPFPTAWQPRASKITSRANGFKQIFPLYFI